MRVAELAVIIRDERPSDASAIRDVTIAAFRDHPHSQRTEQFIIDGLRSDGALTVSLVAERDGEVVGHLALSPVEMSDGTPDWYGLGPVAVLPAYQKRGIGRALISEGLSRLKDLGARGCVLVGDPGYYAWFGFRNHPALVHEGVPQEVFLALPFDSRVPHGGVTFHPAFRASA